MPHTMIDNYNKVCDESCQFGVNVDNLSAFFSITQVSLYMDQESQKMRNCLNLKFRVGLQNLEEWCGIPDSCIPQVSTM